MYMQGNISDKPINSPDYWVLDRHIAKGEQDRHDMDSIDL